MPYITFIRAGMGRNLRGSEKKGFGRELVEAGSEQGKLKPLPEVKEATPDNRTDQTPFLSDPKTPNPRISGSIYPQLRIENMTTFNTCRFCDNWRDQGLVKYGTRHYAHFKCYLDAGKRLSDLPAWRVEEFPYFMLKERGLLDEARRITNP